MNWASILHRNTRTFKRAYRNSFLEAKCKFRTTSFVASTSTSISAIAIAAQFSAVGQIAHRPKVHNTKIGGQHLGPSIFMTPDTRPRKRRRLSKPSKKTRDFPSGDDVLLEDIEALRVSLDTSDHKTQSEPVPEKFAELEIDIKDMSCSGEGLGISTNSDYIFSVPFSTIGDKVLAKVVQIHTDGRYATTDFVKILHKSDIRDDSSIRCQYFSKCAGCQIQMLPSTEHSKFKRRTIERAYKYFSKLDPSHVPHIEETMQSPLQWGYRTKLTPHFDQPPGKRSDRRNGTKAKYSEVPPIGFQYKGPRKVLDIEDCPLGTQVVRLGLKLERDRVARELDTYSSGATLLLRESTNISPTNHRTYPPEGQMVAQRTSIDEGKAVITEITSIADKEDIVRTKTCVTDSKAQATEYIGEYTITNTAGSFFQNNNSILPPFLDYVRSAVTSKTSDWPSRYLVDAYSGSGMFTITLSSLFKSSIAVDVDERSIESAKANAVANSIPEGRATFLHADAAALFEKISFPAKETVMVIDPPRKGCSTEFINQLIEFGPAVIVYVSCNVHTQARDVGEIVRRGGYKIKSLRGFDFFPQTAHVEGVAVLTKGEETEV